MSRVIRYGADRTNQKLYFARLALRAAATQDNQQIEQMHREEAIFHLAGAIKALVSELGYFYGLRVACSSIEECEMHLASVDQVSPEMQRMKQLMDGEFLGQIVHAYSLCETPPKTEKKPEAGELIFTSEGQWLADTTIIDEWRIKLKELVDWIRTSINEN